MNNTIQKIEGTALVTFEFNHGELLQSYVVQFMKVKRDYHAGKTDKTIAITTIARIIGAYSAHTMEEAHNGMYKATFEEREKTINIMDEELLKIINQ